VKSNPPAAGTAAPALGTAVPDRSQLWVVSLLLVIVGVFQLGSGVVSAIVPIKLANSGFAPSILGWVSTAFSIGFLAGCIGAAQLIGALGINRVIVIMALANAAATIARIVPGWLAIIAR